MQHHTSNITKKIFALALLCLSFFAFRNADRKIQSPGEEVKDYHQTAATKFVNVGENKYAYRILGKGKGMPLIMVPSLGSTMDDWDPAVTNGLAQNRTVILFDLEGAGSSTGKTPDNISDLAKGVMDFVKALGYKKVDMMGFSMGSFITQQIALTDPGIINKIILTGTGPKGAEGLSNLPNLLGAAAGLSPQESFLKFAFTGSDASTAAGKEAWTRIQKRIVNRDLPLSAESGGAEFKAVMGWAQPNSEALNELKKINQPVLIVQGENDIPVPVINAINMSKKFPNAKLITYPDAGHAAFFQFHDKFVASANDFLKN